MVTVYKYPLEIDDWFEITLPKFAKFLHVDMQDGIACVWALVDTEQPPEKRKLRLVGTGDPMELDYPQVTDWSHIGTFFLGPVVFHLFETASLPMPDYDDD